MTAKAKGRRAGMGSDGDGMEGEKGRVGDGAPTYFSRRVEPGHAIRKKLHNFSQGEFANEFNMWSKVYAVNH